MNVIDELYKLTEYKLFNDAKQVYVEREDVRCMLEKVINLKVAKISLNENELTEVEKLLAKQGDVIVPYNIEISPLIQPEEQPCEDAISKKDVLDLIREAGKFSLCAMIEELPPIQPKAKMESEDRND